MCGWERREEGLIDGVVVVLLFSGSRSVGEVEVEMQVEVG